MDKNRFTARSAAYRSLMLCERDKKYSNLEIDSAIRRFRLEGAEKGLYTALVYGVIERRITLDHIIGKLSSKPVESLDAEVMTLLRLGLYQMIYLDRIPDSAAVNETVNLSKQNVPRAASFINAVLRGFLRTADKDKLFCPDMGDRRHYLSVRYSCGMDVLDVLMGSFVDAEPILAAFSEHSDVTLRVNTLKTDRDELLAQLAGKGIAAEATQYSPYGVKLTKKTISSEISELLSRGYVYIQDEASQIASIAADPKPETVLIDTCACPGGKSFSAAILMENRGEVKSFDLHKNKLSLIESGAKRLGIDIITTTEKNGSVTDASLLDCADTVICDVPCSGLGVIAKKPEIRYKSRAEIDRLPEIQYSILETAAKYVKRGGVLCYSTCTLNKAENESVVQRFLEYTDEYVPEDFSVGGISSEGGMLTLLPQIHGTDGFFIAKLRRK
ncbi:MAG: 16S rRNA (cytosine(967)-C(5))-methyltransferase RsmB [Clostridia bacterium]|nr:16S rRNA (cytosine(967)-C(5))-methyltransferase RsmB [Clostridia bacterium]